MRAIQITQGRYVGRILRRYTLSSDERYVQVVIGWMIEEFKLGFDCRWM